MSLLKLFYFLVFCILFFLQTLFILLLFLFSKVRSYRRTIFQRKGCNAIEGMYSYSYKVSDKEGKIQSFQLLCSIDSFEIMIRSVGNFPWKKILKLISNDRRLSSWYRETFCWSGQQSEAKDFPKINWSMNHIILSGRGTWARRAHWTSSMTSRRTHYSGFSGRQGTPSHYQKINLGMVSWGKEYILLGIAGIRKVVYWV